MALQKFLSYLEKRHVGLNFGLSIHLHSFFVLEAWLESSEDSCKTAHIALFWQAVFIIGLPKYLSKIIMIITEMS